MKKIIACLILILLCFSVNSWGLPCSNMGMSVISKCGGIEPETLTQQARIIADGGTIIDIAYMNNVIRTMKAQGIYTSAKFIGDANIAVKKDGSNAVSKLYDISGNNNDAIQATGANQPIWTAGVQNGKAGLVFTQASSHYLEVDSIATSFSGTDLAISVVVTGKQTAVNSYQAFISFGKVADTNPILVIYCDSPKGIFRTRDTAGILKTATTTNNLTTNAKIISVISSGVLANWWLNSLTQEITDYNVDAGVVTLDRARIGAVAHTAIPADFYNGSMDNIIVFSTALTTAQRQAIESLINTYYAIY